MFGGMIDQSGAVHHEVSHVDALDVNDSAKAEAGVDVLGNDR
jgi:hypothetical protein